jgi:hypothetical protein
VLDVTLRRSAALRLADWKAQAGKSLETKSLVAILDDADPAYNGKEHYNDLLTVRDSSGKVVWQKSNLSISQSVSGNHELAADPQRGTLWVTEAVGRRLINFSRDGAINWEKQDVHANAVAIDPKTGNGWVLTENGTIYGDALIVFGADGRKLHEWKLKGLDIAYSAHDDCFWLAGKRLQKVDREGNFLAESSVDFPWVATSVSVNEKDGSVWVAEGRHPNVTESRGRVWIFEPDGRTRKSFSVDVDNRCVVVDAPRGAAWVSGRTGTYKVDLDGQVLTAIPVAGALCVEGDTGYVWLASSEGAWRLDMDGKPVWGEATPKSQKWVCMLPPAP